MRIQECLCVLGAWYLICQDLVNCYFYFGGIITLIRDNITPTHHHYIDCNKAFTNKKADCIQFAEGTEFAFAQTTIPTNIHTTNIIFTNIILMRDKHNIPKGKMHTHCMLLHDHIVCKITQRINTKRANTCDPALKLLNESFTYTHT